VQPCAYVSGTRSAPAAPTAAAPARGFLSQHAVRQQEHDHAATEDFKELPPLEIEAIARFFATVVSRPPAARKFGASSSLLLLHHFAAA
jgi:hypothetical protein